MIYSVETTARMQDYILRQFERDYLEALDAGAPTQTLEALVDDAMDTLVACGARVDSASLWLLALARGAVAEFNAE
jgi:hypothetical protein